MLARLMLSFVVACCSLAVSNAADKPNFVLIFIDDMGYGDIGPYGSKVNPTPNLDRMAAEGMKLTSFYAAPVCSASRAQLMTGCYAPRVSVPGVFFPAGPKGLNPKEKTVAEYLKELGYATMCVGKWHLGDQKVFLPTRQGFDHYFGIPYSNDMGRKSAETGLKVSPLLRDEDVAELLEDEDQRKITRAYTEEAVKFIETNKDHPFFLYLPHTAVHVPIYPHQDFVGKTDNGRYGDWVAEVDWSVGQVLDALRRLSLAKDTLVIFTSDNGPWMSRGKDGGVATPLRGSKGGTLEGGVREPTIAWWPKHIEAGSSNDSVAGTTDILPTFVSLAGGKLDPDIKIDGHDLSQVLLGNAKKSKRDAWHYYQGTQLKAVRSGPWKLAIASQSLGMGIKEKPKDLQSNLRLYNLDNDISEMHNVAEDYPEVVARLLKLTDEMKADIGSGQPGPGVRPAGQVDNPVTLYPTAPNKRISKPSGRPIDWKKAKLGETYASNSAPTIAGTPFSIDATVEGNDLKGVIVAHGGSAVGYSLYAKDGKIVFAIRLSNTDIERVAVPLSGSKTDIHAELDLKGIMSVTTASKASAQARLISRQPQESLGIGLDDQNPVDPQAPRGRFNGKITSLEVEVGAKK